MDTGATSTSWTVSGHLAYFCTGTFGSPVTLCSLMEASDCWVYPESVNLSITFGDNLAESFLLWWMKLPPSALISPWPAMDVKHPI